MGADRGRFCALLPIVVRFDQIAVAVAQLQRRVCQHARDAELGKAWPERTNYHRLRCVSPDNKSSDQNGSAGANVAARRHVAEATGRVAQIINFEKRDPALGRLLRTRK